MNRAVKEGIIDNTRRKIKMKESNNRNDNGHKADPPAEGKGNHRTDRIQKNSAVGRGCKVIVLDNSHGGNGG